VRELYCGDNLEIIGRRIAPGSVDLIYLDPPFKSDADYPFRGPFRGGRQTAFTDIWAWDAAARQALSAVRALPPPLSPLVAALALALGESPMLAYLVHMALRLPALHAVLKPTGSLYLHCDPSASHYLKLILDALFGAEHFRNEIIWRRTGAHNKARRWAPLHDVILFYTKTGDYTWNRPRRPYMAGHVRDHFAADGAGGYRTKYYGNVLTGSGIRAGESGRPWRGFDPTAKGRHWAVPGGIWAETGLDPTGLGQHEKLELLHGQGLIRIVPGQAWPVYERRVEPGQGPAAGDLWAFAPYTEGTVHGSAAGIDADVRWLTPKDGERLGYPTQKPLGLLRRIIAASSNPGDLVLDPYCGSGTTLEAAEQLGRGWIGIDLSPEAVRLVRELRLAAVLGEA
jgi:site-specific DNA-methyltransferase (adenine-specific)